MKKLCKSNGLEFLIRDKGIKSDKGRDSVRYRHLKDDVAAALSRNRYSFVKTIEERVKVRIAFTQSTKGIMVG